MRVCVLALAKLMARSPAVPVHTEFGVTPENQDTRGMLFEKAGQDLFRHIILGLGSGDMRIVTTGARREEILIPNVLFVDSHLRAMQQLHSHRTIR